jgi:SWI/SNF-related matrix-associated actin-dependent regulator of chromatin subfamily A-like protein 1
MIPKTTQSEGAKFLAERKYALLADLPRCGKTGSAIMAADYVAAENILVVTTASGRGVWKAGFPAWSAFPRKIQVLTGSERLRPDTNVAIVGWGALTQNARMAELLSRQWDLIIPDEAHNAKNFEAKRTQSLFGRYAANLQVYDDQPNGPTADWVHQAMALCAKTARTWLLTGTPLPNSPADAYPMLRTLWPERLSAQFGPTDVTKQADFIERYCKMRPMKIGHGWAARTIQVFVEGRNLDELNARMQGVYLQRTQKDVGIIEPEYETMPLISPKDLPAELRDVRHAKDILAAAQAGDGKRLEIHMGPLRRITGMLKAELVADAVKEELDAGLDKIVLAYWHTDVGAALLEKLAKYGVTSIDGSTPGKIRTANEQKFLRDPKCRVFLAQIQAAGEAIDLSSAHNLIFVEMSFIPKDGMQMAMRVTNHGQKNQPLVRVATLEGSIDDAIQNILIRKLTAIRQVLK